MLNLRSILFGLFIAFNIIVWLINIGLIPGQNFASQVKYFWFDDLRSGVFQFILV